MSNKIDLDYQNLIKDILENGTVKETRNGKTLSLFGKTIKYKFVYNKAPLITTKKMAFKSIVTELIWFLRGDTNIKFLLDNNCHIWDGDSYKYYTKHPCATISDHNTNILYKNLEKGWCIRTGLSFMAPDPTRHLTKEEFIEKIKSDDEFAKTWGDLGFIYGKQWRRWQFTEIVKEDKNAQVKLGHIDQIACLISELKNNPDSRRLLVTAWNPGELDQCVLPPCHYAFQVYTRELTRKEKIDWVMRNSYETGMEREVIEACWKDEDFHCEYYDTPKRAISLIWNQRSVDIGLGLPFNIASYSLLLIVFGKMLNMIPEELIGNLGDCHIYSNQIDEIKKQITKEPYELPTISFSKKTETIFNKFRGCNTLEDKNLGKDFGYYNNVENVINSLKTSDFVLENYKSHPKIHFPLSN